MEDEIQNEIRIKLGHGIAGEVAKNGVTLNIPDAYKVSENSFSKGNREKSVQKFVTNSPIPCWNFMDVLFFISEKYILKYNYNFGLNLIFFITSRFYFFANV